jgi:release factor glutamine methyltransferase
MTSLNSIRSLYNENLGTLYEKHEIESIFSRIANHLLNYSKIQIQQNLQKGIDQPTENKFSDFLLRLKKGEPLQYIFGFVEFYNTIIRVDQNVLIPRPETEFMVDLIVKENKNSNEQQIIDLCTGSGCMAVALAKALNNSTVSATDISEKALKLARQNAMENNAEILFIQDDLLNPKKKYNAYDLIISNPPYVREMEKKSMHINVLRYEPELALFVPDTDPLIYYRALAIFGLAHLDEKGTLFAEINEQLGEETKEIFLLKGFKKVDIKKDIHQKDRYLIARL